MKEKIRSLLNDSVWSIAGLVFMNCAAQFMVYPFWNKLFGVEKYGVIIYLISLINIVANTIGMSCGYARIKISSEHTTKNGEYLVILAVGGVVSAVYASLVCMFNSSDMTPRESVSYVILCCLIMMRFYADVEYRLKINYKGYFVYYLLIGLGYMLGTYLMYLTGIWTLALIPGELAGLLFVMLRGSIFGKDGTLSREHLKEAVKVFVMLTVSNFLEQLVFNADRILLKHAVGDAAVSVFYISTLLGKTAALVTTPFNGVISGYLARYKGRLTFKSMNIISAVSMAAALAAAGLCSVGSYIVLPILYPDTFELAKGCIFIGNLTQTVFFTANIITVIMLRFTPSGDQVVIGTVFAAAFAAVCIPMTVFGGSRSFYIGLLITVSLRFMTALAAGYRQVFRERKAMREDDA